MTRLLFKLLKEFLEVLFVSFHVLACYQDIIYIYECEIQSLKDSVHHALESLGGIFEAKRHPKKLKKTKWCNDGSLKNICFGHQDLVVALNQVDLEEHSHAR